MVDAIWSFCISATIGWPIAADRNVRGAPERNCYSNGAWEDKCQKMSHRMCPVTRHERVSEGPAVRRKHNAAGQMGLPRIFMVGVMRFLI